MPSQSNSLSYHIIHGSKHSASPKPSLGYSDVIFKSRTRTWSSTAGFRKKRKSGPKGYPFLVPMNSYTDYQWHRELGEGQLILREQNIFDLIVWGVFNAPNITDPILPLPGHSALLNSCIERSSKEANGNSFSVPIFIGEFHKTRAMFARAVSDVAKAMKKRKISDRSIEDTWLEYRYGWRLAVKDLYDALVKIHDFRTRGVVSHSRVSRRRTEESTWIAPDAGIPRYCNSTTVFGMDYTITRKDTLITTLVLNWTSTSSGDLLGNLQSLGITNPLSVAWELTPYSFVVDWFINVGSYLNTLDAFIGKSFKTGCISYTLIRETTAKARNVVGKNGFVLTSKSVPSNTTYERVYKRVPLSDFPSATPPRFDVHLNASRVIDAASILRQQEKRYR